MHTLKFKFIITSDGLGRTGSFCALMLCHDRFKTEHMADVFYAIKTMRTQRPGMVENTVRPHHVYNVLTSQF